MSEAVENVLPDSRGLPRFVWVLIVACVLLAGLAGFAGLMRARKIDLPVLAEVPPIAMTDQTGAPVTLETLRGRPWIADFIFLSCKASCPKLTARMKTVHDQIAKKSLTVRLVSITVDPENDTPPKLMEYARSYGANAATWSFLTGPTEDLDRVVVKGFKLQYGKVKGVAGAVDPNATVFTIMHGDWFVLVDAKARIRGYYDTDRPEKLEAIVRDAEHLARNPGT